MQLFGNECIRLINQQVQLQAARSINTISNNNSISPLIQWNMISKHIQQSMPKVIDLDANPKQLPDVRVARNTFVTHDLITLLQTTSIKHVLSLFQA